jgi:uncharacterized membrane protein YjfL (UPF0719 family)
MIITDIMTSASQNTGVIDILMYGTGGSVITMILQKLLEFLKPKSERQINKFDVVDRLEKVVQQLQDVACYKDKCKERMNGETV